MRRKRGLLVLLAGCLLLTGCGGQGSAPEEAAPVSVTEAVTLYPLPGGCRPEAMARTDKALCVAGQKEGQYALAFLPYEENGEGQIVFSEPQRRDLAEGETLLALTAAPDRVYALMQDGTGGCRIDQYDPEGAPRESREIQLDDPADVRGLCVTGSGRLLVQDGRQLCLYGEGPESIQRLEPGTGLSLLSLSPSGAGPVLSCAAAETSAQTPAYFLYDEGQNELLPLSLPDAPREFNFSVTQGLAGEYLINDGSAFFACDPAAGTVTELLSWREAAQGFFLQVCRLGESAFALLDGEGARLLLVCRRTLDVSESQRVRAAPGGGIPGPRLHGILGVPGQRRRGALLLRGHAL